jgi:hypothetical protein
LAAVSAIGGTSLGGLLAATARAQENSTEASEIAAIESLAAKDGLGKFAVARTEHFLGLGNAPDRFRSTALDICEGLGKEFLAYFQSRGFKLAYPQKRMTVITLNDDASYRAFAGDNPGVSVGGHYDLETNRLVVFDFRPKQAELDINAERVNLFTLVHETAHLLCFNTGLLNRKADEPLCVREGLAAFFEMWRPAFLSRGKKRTPIGSVNRPRLEALVAEGQLEKTWIPLADLVRDDELVRDEKTQQVGYAESWVLMHYLVTTPGQLPRLKAYLAAIPPENDTAARDKIAEQHLGPLDKLDHAVLAHARRQLKK